MKRLLLILPFLLLAACQSIQQPLAVQVPITISVDSREVTVQLPANSTVQNALIQAGVALGSLDRVDPPINTIVAMNDHIQVIRVREEYTEQTETIPFEQQVVKNESLPEGETRLLQAGVNGERVVTYKQVFEDNLQISNLEFKSVILKEAIPEITMIGVQAPFTSQTISGTLAYIDNGNAWIIEGSTGNRRPLVTTGDLDGHVFAMSYDREWLLYSRKAKLDEGKINSLWVIRVNKENSTPIDLKISNVINFADFIPNSSRTIAYSTVEPRDSAPGWQANNDLFYKTFSSSSTIGSAIDKVGPNSGGIYGWWGISYFWAPDGSRLAFARPDSVGTVNLSKGSLNTVSTITPYDTHSDWAWVSGISWSPDGKFLIGSKHNPGGNPEKPESSTVFDLTAFSLGDEPYQVVLDSNSGMFSNPACSPFTSSGNYHIAYLQAIFPEQSDSSRYRLVVMDQDGSNKATLLPEEGSAGLNAQTIYWTPDFKNGAFLAVIDDGNLWLVDATTGQNYQVTGDNLVTRISWR